MSKQILLRVRPIIKRVDLPALITLITLLLYYPGLGGPFLLDDFANIVNNSAIQIGALSFSSLREAAFSSNAGPLYRPVAMLTFALNYHFGGLSHLYYKAVNIGIHLAMAIMLFFLTEALLRRLAVYEKLSPGILSPRQLAALITILWALHPLHVSTVLYVVQRMTELAALFSVAGVLLYVRGREMLIAGKQRSGIILVVLGAIGCGMLAALSKENGALLPVLLLIVEALFFRGTRANQPLARLVFVLLALQTAAILAYLFYVWAGPFHPTRGYTSTERLLTETRILFSYAGQILVPRIDQMSLFGENTAVSRGLFTPLSTAVAVIAMLALISSSLWAAYNGRATLFVFGVGWFLAGHLLESTVIPLELRFEHRNYLPSYGLIFAFIYTLSTSNTLARLRPSLHYSLIIAVIIGCGSMLHSRVAQWSGMDKLIRHELTLNPESARAWVTFAHWEKQHGNFSLATKLYEKAAMVQPDEIGHQFAALQLRLTNLGENPSPKVIEPILTGIRVRPLTPYGETQLQAFAISASIATVNDPQKNKLVSSILLAATQQSIGPHPELKAMCHYMISDLAKARNEQNQAIEALAAGIILMPLDGRKMMLVDYLAEENRKFEAREVLSTINEKNLSQIQRERFLTLKHKVEG